MSGDLSQYDITRRMAPYLDPHFMFPVLKWLREHNIFPDADVLAAEYELASKSSNMITYVQETHAQLVEALKATGRDASAVPAPEFNADALQADFKARMDAGKGAWDVLADAAAVAEMQKESTLTLEGLTGKGATEAEVNSIFDLARFYHKAGLYKQALETIVLYRKVGPQDGSYRYFSAIWAQLAECICMLLNPESPSSKKPLSSIGGNEPSDFALRVLRDTVEKRTTLEGVKEVEQRRWMLHWSLFVIFSRPKAHDELFDLFFAGREARSEQRTRKNDYLAIAQAVSPWLLRYAAYSAVLNHKNIGKRQKQFVQVLAAEEANYSGPMTKFFVAVFQDFDMGAALAAVRDAADVIRADFFLGGMAARVRGGNVDAVVADFQQAALRIVFFEILKLHQEVNYDQATAKYFSDFPSVTANSLRLWVAEYDRANNSSSSSSSNKGVSFDETKESVQCHQLFKVQITTIHQRIDQQTSELKNTANKMRNRFNEDRMFERDMGAAAGGGGGGKGGSVEHVPFTNQLNSRDPRNRGDAKAGGDKKQVAFDLQPYTNKVNSRDPRGADGGGRRDDSSAAPAQAPVRQNTRWKADAPKAAPKTKAAAGAAGPAGAPAAAPSPTNARWTQDDPKKVAGATASAGAAPAGAKQNADGSWERAPKPAGGSAESSSWR